MIVPEILVNERYPPKGIFLLNHLSEIGFYLTKTRHIPGKSIPLFLQKKPGLPAKDRVNLSITLAEK